MEQSTFLTDVREQLPEYCIFDKGKVGCGGTTMALKAKEPYVICVPFRSLIDNKISQYEKGKILGVHSGTTKKEISEYVETSSNPKIMVTYNSLNKLNDVIDTDEFKLLVDEYHLLFTQYSFRSEAVRVVLENYFRYKSYVFMTATPIEEEFILKELKHLPVVKQEWDNQVSIKVNTVLCERGARSKSVQMATIKMILDFLSGREKGNAYFFVNSVEFINEIINANELKLEQAVDSRNAKYILTRENCKVVYSLTNKKKLRIKNSDLLGKTKKINFLTSTAFEGSDIYDPEGRIIIVSDPSKPHTMIDISTSINQIAGRIRDSRYIDTITHIYAPTRYSELGYEEFLDEMMKLSEKANEIVSIYNSVQNEDTKHFIKLDSITTESYNTVINGKLQFDENKVKIDIFNYRVVRGLYALNVTLNSEYGRNGYEVKESLCMVGNEQNTQTIFEGRPQFAVIAKELRDIARKGDIDMENNDRFQCAFAYYPFLQEAINVLGWGKIGTLKYSIKDIKEQLGQSNDESINIDVASKLSRSFMVGEFYPMAYVKSKIQEAYKLLGLPGGKAVDICIYYEVRPTMRRINGERKDGYLIIGKKMVFKP